ncbi:hypothetical protein G7Z17_g10138 [Cylindrodendrum hubeiense]|uniref:Molybdopterin synthase sulfur carrier subunit n=1 Tax=Cylindrodendrum hubeiense TaxID=595255 RepID=A0A9P5H045_9HYPO|nr:hypothetical protein G7Z17_g10138 [Cylindrodendrum hubeiense]
MASAPKPPAGHFNILYFASASSFTGKDHEALPAMLPLRNLFAELESRYPGIKAKVLDSCLVTVNLDYVDVSGEEGSDDTVLQEADEVAIIPPERLFLCTIPPQNGPPATSEESPPPRMLLVVTAKSTDAEHQAKD